ncbi:MAG: gamma-glutamyl-gamma-aminobutyrate hydrolase family protein [Actinomycetes bacterium]
MTARPLIAVPAYPVRKGRVEGWVYPAAAVPTAYLDAVVRAGGEPAILSPRPVDPDTADAILAGCAGLLLLGGGDVDPARYGEEAHPRTYGVSPVRDEFELALLAAARRSRIPVLGICRGAQLLAVASGSTLDQHISDREDLDPNGRPGVEDGAEVHEVEVLPDTHLAQILGAGPVRASCHHHQAIAAIPDGLRLSAVSPDGIVEGIETTDDHWCVAVQWHPEDTAGEDPTQQGLFDAFVDACR